MEIQEFVLNLMIMAQFIHKLSGGGGGRTGAGERERHDHQT